VSVRLDCLDNGLRVITQDAPHLETAALGVWVEAGSRFEDAEVNGVSHVLEHMAFKGTARRSAQEIVEEIEAVGGHLNAYTSREQTAYHARVLKGDVRLAIDILADILQHSVFAEDELARERGVIVHEIGEAFDTPDDLVFDHFQEAAYPQQPLGRSILGPVEIVAGMERDTLIDYMARHYSAPRMVLSAVGRVDHDRIVAQAAEAFDALPTHNDARQAPARYVGGERRTTRELEQLHVVLGFDGVAYDDPDYYVQQVMAQILGGGMSSRLFQEVREKRGLAYSVFCFAASYRDGGTLGIYAGTGPGKVGELMPVICGELTRLGETISEKEIARVRAQIKASLLMALESPSARCEQLARQMLIFGRPLATEEIVGKIEAIDTTAIKRVAERAVGSGPVSFASLGPEAEIEAYDALQARFA
jgi:predicted Zn-dependent peptidase